MVRAAGPRRGRPVRVVGVTVGVRATGAFLGCSGTPPLVLLRLLVVLLLVLLRVLLLLLQWVLSVVLPVVRTEVVVVAASAPAALVAPPGVVTSPSAPEVVGPPEAAVVAPESPVVLILPWIIPLSFIGWRMGSGPRARAGPRAVAMLPGPGSGATL